MNNFYASVECMLNPELRGKSVAVCGSVDDRHGIVLAKSQTAKECGIQTGDVVWEAKKKCPDLIVVPPNFYEYQKYSKLAQQIYYTYTDLVEPYGLDECFLDVTKSVKLFGTGEQIANKIRQDMKDKLNLTISVGVSFNKIFAKLGSDMKKPDATTVLSEENFKQKIYGLNANEIIGVGKATYAKLLRYNIKTIGDLAAADPMFLTKLLGKNGNELWNYANGRDFSRVASYHDYHEQKSVSNGITCTTDLLTNYEVYRVILKLSQDVGKRLRKIGLYATKVKLSIKTTDLKIKEYQKPLKSESQSFNEIADACNELFLKNFNWNLKVRAVSVSAIDLVKDKTFEQIDLFDRKTNKKEKLEQTMEQIRERFGKSSIEIASLTEDIKINKDKSEVKVLPSSMKK